MKYRCYKPKQVPFIVRVLIKIRQDQKKKSLVFVTDKFAHPNYLQRMASVRTRVHMTFLYVKRMRAFKKHSCNALNYSMSNPE